MIRISIIAIFSTLILAGCLQGPGGTSDPLGVSGMNPGGSQTGPMTIPAGTRRYDVDVLLFAGAGAWGSEVSSLEGIFRDKGVNYRKVDSRELDAMPLEEMVKFGMIVWPGGSGGTQADSLSTATHLRLREAVQKNGVGFIGFCAGAWVEVAPPTPGRAEYGLGIVPGTVLDYYHPLEDKGVAHVSVPHAFADGRNRQILWYGGPVTLNTPGGVVAKYPNGQPAITQQWSGNGFVMSVAGHPTVTDEVKDSLGVADPDGSDQDLAWELMEATLKQAPLKAF